jgi:predicted RNase H-like nuclease (RuvC/YqgF family)
MSLSSIYGNPFLGERKRSPLDEMSKVVAKPKPGPAEPKVPRTTKAKLAAEVESLKRSLDISRANCDGHVQTIQANHREVLKARQTIYDHAVARQELEKARQENNKLAAELQELKDNAKSFANMSKVTWCKVRRLELKGQYGLWQTYNDPTEVTITF